MDGLQGCRKTPLPGLLLINNERILSTPPPNLPSPKGFRNLDIFFNVGLGGNQEEIYTALDWQRKGEDTCWD